MADHDALRTSAEKMYKNIGSVYCPYFKADVTFGAEGFEHLLFKTRRHPRDDLDRVMRLKFLHYAPEIVKITRTLQGVREGMSFERIRRSKRNETVLVRVTYYEFIAIFSGRRFKVVIKQIENGQRFFWSFMPLFGFGSRDVQSFFLGQDNS